MQKGSQLSGAAVTEEVFESSDHITAKNQHGGWKGLQQFFTPPEASKLAAYVTGSGSAVRVPVFDPTAGDGSLLLTVPNELSFGVEIDADQIKSAEDSYHAVRGDIQKVYPLIQRVSPQFPAVWANPPFGLKDWSDDTVRGGKAVGSAVLSFIYASRILAEDGQLVFICGRNQFHREIAQLPEAKGIYFVVECDDLFDGTSHPSAIAFGVHPELRENVYDRETRDYIQSEGFETKTVPREMLDLLGPAIVEAREKAIGDYNRVATHAFGGGSRFEAAWEAVRKETERRRKLAEDKKQKRSYDIELVGKKLLNCLPSPFSTMALANSGLLADVKKLHNKPLTYFANYERDWKTVEEAMDKGLIAVDPKVVEAVEEVLHVSRRTTCPLYPIKEVQRLGYLTDLNEIVCKKDDPERGFHKGESYPITTRTMTIVTSVTKLEQATRGKNAGEWVEREYEQQRKALKVTIDGNWHFTDTADSQSDIQFLIDHFQLPDPGDVGTRYPEETEENRKLIRQIEADTLIPNAEAYAEDHPDKVFTGLRRFQVEDLARMMVKKDGLLAWEQGLGKTLAGLTYAEACFRKGGQRAALFVVPQDLIPQWQAECKRFLGVEMELIKTHGQAKTIAKKLRMGGEGLYVTYYEALSIVGTSRSEFLPEQIVEVKKDFVKMKGTGRNGPGKLAIQHEGSTEWLGVTVKSGEPIKSSYLFGADRVLHDADGTVVEPADCRWVPQAMEVRGEAAPVHFTYIGEQWVETEKNLTSKQLCPKCKADYRSGWNGKYCRAEGNDGSVCGYSHYKHRVKPMGSLLSTAFRRGVIAVDELTMIQGDYSERSKVVRGLNAKFKIGMTGTPVKNYIPQAFWLLWWCLGNASKRFPYDYGSKGDFENNHAVVQWSISGGKKMTRKVLPEVTNLSQLWRLLASSIIRRRKEETGEPMVPRTFHPITVPLGESQREQMEKWRKDFALFFEEKYPDAPVVKAGAHHAMAPMLGLGMKLDYAATIPQGDPDYEWTGVEGVSDFTPANLRALEITMALVKQGRKVLLGSQWIPTAKWFCERLEEKGIRAAHMLDAAGNTAPPEKRAKVVAAFQHDDLQVLCVGIQAIRLGHNLDQANAAVINGLPWDWESFDQFVARIHRLTSKKDVDIYVTIPGSQSGDQGTITRRKYDILRQKGDAASLALDGRLIEHAEEPVSEEQVVRDLVEKGIPLSGDEVPEENIEQLWAEMSHIDHYEFDESILTSAESFTEEQAPTEVVGAEDAPVTVPTEAEAEAGRAEEAEADVAPEPEPEPEAEQEPEEDRCETCGVPLLEDEETFCDVCAAAAGAAAAVAEAVPEVVLDDTLTEEEASEPTWEVTPGPGNTLIEDLKQLAELHTAEVLTDDEFAEAKAALIAAVKAKPAATPDKRSTTEDQLSLVGEEV